MKRSSRIVLWGVLFIIGIIVVASLAHLLQIRGEFSRHLSANYPEHSFEVGWVKLDLLYEKYYAKVRSDDEPQIPFPIVKSFNTKLIHDDYLQTKNQAASNKRIQDLFAGNEELAFIQYATASSKWGQGDGAKLDQISIELQELGNHPEMVGRILRYLRSESVDYSQLYVFYEADNGVYQGILTPLDADLSETELAAKLLKIK